MVSDGDSQFANYRVLLLSGNLRLSGSSTWILAMQGALRQLGCPVTHIVLGDHSEVAVPEEYSLIYTGRARSHPLLRFSRLLQLHKLFPDWFAARSDQVLNHRVAQILAGLGWQERLDLVIKDFTCDAPSCFGQQPVLAVIHQSLSARWDSDPRLRGKVRAGYRLAAVSSAVAADARQLGLNVVDTLYNPLDPDRLRRLAAAASPVGNYIVYAGKLDRSKGVVELLEAYARSGLQQQLWYVGSGPEQQCLEDRAAELGLVGQVQFLGFQSNPYPFIQSAQLLVLPSRSEAMGYVCIEAAVLGTAFLVSDYPAAAEFFQPEAIIALEPQASFSDRLARRMVEVLSQASEPALQDDVLGRLEPRSVGLSYLKLVPELATAEC
jgi:glycosyltransferase involved in cell wall biosynthesis